mgnify:CR=1 FL=1
MADKFDLGDIVSINGRGRYKIFGFEYHGNGVCECCKGEKYRMVYFNENNPRFIINEDQLQKYTGN